MSAPYTNEDVDELYRLIGKAVWHLQHLENIVASNIVLKKLQKLRESGKKISQSDLGSAQKVERKKTLGPLIKTAIQEGIIFDTLLSKFGVFLEERNWLIHKCVINEYLALRNRQAKMLLFKRITTFTENTISLQEDVHKMFENWLTDNGYDLNYAYKLAYQQLADAEKS